MNEVLAMRDIQVYNTLGGNLTTIRSAASTWGELQLDLDRAGIEYRKMSAVIGETQVTLESPAAQVLRESFQLFLVPKQVKSGQLTEHDINLIDTEEGMLWSDLNWDKANEIILEDYMYRSYKDLTIARAMKARAYINSVIAYLVDNENKAPDSPEVTNLQKTAEEIKRNLGIWD